MQKSSKKVLIFSLAYFPKLIGGAEIAVKEITDRITDIDFSMVTIRGSHELKFERIGNIDVYRVGPMVNLNSFFGKIIFYISKYTFPCLAYQKAKSLHTKEKFNTVWSIMANHAGFAALFFKKKFPDVRFVLTLQEGDPIPYIKRKVRFVYGWFKQIFKKADYVQAISTYLLNFARDMGYRGEGSVIGNGVGIDHFSKELPEKERKSLRSKFGFNDSDIVLVTASRLVEKNAVGDIISALSLLPENYKLLIIGSGQLERDLKSQISNLKLESKAQFLGHISHNELPAYLHASNIFIRPSLSEGLGNSFLEAMAAGLPVIATSVGGIVDFLKDGETGIFCEVQNPESITSAVIRLSDNSLRSNLMLSGRRVVNESYDWKIITRRMREIL